jgi:hypothetical protein
MRKITYFKTMLLTIILMVGSGNVCGQTIDEDFTYGTLSSTITDSPISWETSGTGNGTFVISNASPLTKTNYNGGGGNYIVVTKSSQNSSNVYKHASGVNSGSNTFFYSFLLNVTGAISSTDQYFISLTTTGSTTYNARIYIKSTTGGYNLGIAKYTGTASYGTSVLSTNTIYLVIVKYVYNPSTADDEMSMWINPALNSEPTTGAEVSDNSSADATNFTSSFGFLLRNTISTPNYSIDGVKVAYASTSSLAWSNLNAYRTSSVTSGYWDNPSVWENSEVPPNGTNVTINNDLILNQDANVLTLNINPDSKLTLNSGNLLTVKNFNINSDATGIGTYVDLNSSGGLTVSGTANVQQYLSSARNWYISSPVSNALAFDGYTYYKYDETGNNPSPVSPATAYWVSVASGTTLTPGTGYIAQSGSAGTYTFTTETGGTLNTADKILTLSRTPADGLVDGFNLVGNPYPSYLNIDNLASNSDIVPTYWYRSYNSGYVFDTYNIPGAISTGLSGLKVSAYVPPMQAFWLRVANGKTSASVNLLNANRSHQDDTNNKFRIPTLSIRQILRLVVSNNLHSDEAVIYTDNNAANAYDKYDSPKMSNNDALVPEIYTIVETEKLVINGLKNIPTNTELSLGFTTGQSNAFSIKATEFSNFDANTKVYLKDKLSNTEFDLTDGLAYDFVSDVTSTNERFSLILRVVGDKTDINTAGISQTILIYKNEKNQIAINYNDITGNNVLVSVYNSTGQKLYSKQITGTSTIIDKVFSSGVYVVIVNNAGISIIQKVIFH